MVLPQPLVGEMIAKRGDMVNLFTVQVCNTHSAISSAAWSGRTT